MPLLAGLILILIFWVDEVNMMLHLCRWGSESILTSVNTQDFNFSIFLGAIENKICM